MMGDIFIRIPNRGHRPKNSKPKERGGGKISLPKNPLHIFTDHSLHTPTNLYEIWDVGRIFPIDKDYKEQGEREGWLIADGYRIGENGEFIYRYIFKG